LVCYSWSLVYGSIPHPYLKEHVTSFFGRDFPHKGDFQSVLLVFHDAISGGYHRMEKCTMFEEIRWIRHLFISVVEDLPEEIGRRFEQMRKWDNDVERLRLECKYAAKRIMEVRETSQPMRDRILNGTCRCAFASMLKYRLIHRLSERKLDLARRSERLMSAVLEKVADSSYLCKIELEVDNPGCTEAIERNFCRMLGLKPTSSHLTSCNVEFEPVEDTKSLTLGQEHGVNGELTSAFDLKDPGVSNINGKSDRERYGSPSPVVTPCESPQRFASSFRITG
ncbi:hypothetical protein COOONC_28144, partial [Cooperia oncophora]